MMRELVMRMRVGASSVFRWAYIGVTHVPCTLVLLEKSVLYKRVAITYVRVYAGTVTIVHK